MSFKGVAAVRDKDDGPSTRPEQAHHFLDGRTVILDMFEHFVAEDQVESPGRERDEFPSRVDDMGRVVVRFDGALEVVFQANDGPPKRGKVLHVHADPAAIFEDAALEAFPGSPDDHFQPALLACPPDVGWLAAQGGFFEVAWTIHARNYKADWEGG